MGKPGRSAVLGAAALVLVACGSGDVTAARSSSPPSAAEPPASAPSASAPPDAEARVDRCMDLNTFQVAAGPAFEVALLPLFDGETPEERRTVSSYVGSMALRAVLLVDTPGAGPHFRAVALAAAEAQRGLREGVPALEAIAPLTTAEASGAREAAVAYRGGC